MTNLEILSESYPHKWEIRYKALVRRLVEIADEVDSDEYDLKDRLADYNRVARAHEERNEEEKED